MNDDEATAAAADLAEEILDEVSRANHSWHAIEHMANALAELAARAATVATGPPRAE